MTYQFISRKNLWQIVLVMLLISGIQRVLAQFNINEVIKKTDTLLNPHKKASSFLFLAEYYMQDQPDSAIIFANEALDIAADRLFVVLFAD